MSEEHAERIANALEAIAMGIASLLPEAEPKEPVARFIETQDGSFEVPQ